MKYFLFILLFASISNAQIVNIPDANFKAKLLAADTSNSIAINIANNYFKIDANDDGEIQESEALQVSDLDVSNSTIASLIGINSFTSLNNLYCSNNQISTLDVSNLVNLNTLFCSNNQMTSLNVINLVNLNRLDCSNNQMTSLDVSNLINLGQLYCSDNQITSLDASNLVNLITLNCSNNQLTSLDISNLINLGQLYCSDNQITSLDASNLVNLINLGCSDNQITSLDVSNLVNLINLQCYNNTLTSLDVSDSVNLTHLNCSNNLLTSLNVSNLVNLIQLLCLDNQLQVLDLSTLTSLRGFNASNNLFYELDFSNNPVIGHNSLLNNDLVYISSNPNLTFINFKNGNTFQSSLSTNSFSNLPSLQFVCLDDFEENTGIELFFNSPNVVFNSYCSFTPGGNFNTIKGAITFDANTNGCDALDVLQPNIRMNINDGTNQGATYSNNAGNYKFYTQTGSFNVQPSLENPTWFTLNPTTATVPFANNNNNLTTQNFCITSNGIHNDVEIVIAPITPARPGFDATYQIVYKNKGNQTLSGAIDFTYNDAVLDFVTASTTPDNQTTGNLSWNYTNLLPFENRTILITLNVNSPMETPAVTIGDILTFSATINPVSGDETPADNVFTYNQTVMGAYDPNSVECLEGETVSPSLIGEYLHYVINFENLGNYQAENVVVKDIIDTNKYDINSLQILNTSHNSYTKLNGNILEFIFENINLAPASGNPPVGGHGTILFKIKSKNSLVPDDFVNKNANIYFDYNAPIETNLETTTFAVLSNSIFVVDESVSVYPNPASSLVTIQCKNTIQSIELYDVQGRLLQVKTTDSKETTLDISDKIKGVYFLKINTEFGSKAIKMVKD